MSKIQTIGICAPSGKFEKDKFERGVEIIHQLGFQTRIPELIHRSHRYLAGSDRERAQVMIQLFQADDVDAVICARGGFGALKILELLPWEELGRSAKPLIGFSDATALLLTMIERTGNHAVHGPMITTLASADPETIEAFCALLEGREDPIQLDAPRVLLPGEARGMLKGGNLATICSMAGTAYQPDFSRCILFIEDVGEAPYKIERMLTQIKMAGMLKGVRGIVLGSFENCGSRQDIDSAVIEVVRPLKIPVIGEIPSGHGTKNLPFVMGSRVRMETAVPGLHRI